MRCFQALVGILLLVGLFGGSHQGMNSGPYDIIFEGVWPCSDASMNKAGLALQPTFKKVNGKKRLLYSGSFNHNFTKEEFVELDLHGDFYQKKSNDFLFMYKFDDKVCKAFSEMAKDLYADFRKQIGLDPEGCVIPPGDYSFSGWDVDIKLPMPMLEYMTYKAIIQILSEKQVYACFEILGTVKRKF